MSQQINLFNPIFLKQKKYFSAVTMAQALALVLAGSLVLAGYSSYRVKLLAQEAATTASQLSAVQTRLETAKTHLAPREKSKALEEEIQKSESQLRSLRRVFETLEKGDFGDTKGYSEYMKAFARQITPGVWLTGFGIEGAGKEIALSGRALQPGLVPVYISRLKQEAVMHGKSFAALEMQTPEPVASDRDKSASAKKVVAGYIEFHLHSSLKESGEPGRVNIK